MNAWDAAIFALAGFLAVVGLVNLMLARRNTLADELRQELEAERRRAQREKQKQQPAAKPAARGGRVGGLNSP